MTDGATMRESVAMTKVPDDHPLMIAWNAYMGTADFENTKGWCIGPYIEGSLWAAFERGFIAASILPHPNPPSGPVANSAGELLYTAYVERSLAEVPEEDRRASSLNDAARFIERWMPESLPASDTGQVSFGRALLEMALASMRAAAQPSEVDLARLSRICARAIADANITNCRPDEVRSVVLAVLADLATGGACRG